jgi:hypothetical protein
MKRMRRTTAGLVAVLVLVPSWASARTNIFRSAFEGTVSTSAPTGVGLGDFNGDGAPEVVSIGAGTLDREISFCNWFGVDDPPPELACSSGQAGPRFPSDLIVEDFDGDGQVDLVISSANEDSVSFLRGRGDQGRIDPPISFPVGATPRRLAYGDINGDQHLDVVTANEGAIESLPGSVTILLGAGDGTFGQPMCGMLEAEVGTAAVALGDLNGDGRLDIVVVNSRAATVSSWLGETGCSFGPRDSVATGSSPMDVALGDLNGDGVLDAVTADNNDDAVSVLFGNGDGTFERAATYAVGTAPNRVLVADLNGDEHLDILASNVRSGDVSLLLGDGRGGILRVRHFVTDSQPRALSIGDLDGDGTPDVLAAVEPEISRVAALLGIGDGSFHAAEDLPAGVQPETVAVADIDNDSYADVLTTSVTGEVLIYRADPAGGFRPVERLAVGGRPFGVVAADLNRDLLPDIAVSDREGGMVAVALGVGGGAFGPVRRFATAAEPTQIVAGDFNADGRVDLAVTAAGMPGSVSVLLQTSTGSFGPARNTTVENTPVGLAAADFDNDGRTDLVVANQASETVQVLRSLGNGNFSITQTLPPSAVGQATALAVADFNADGRADFAVSDFGPGGENVRLFLGNGNATFQAGQSVRAGDQPRALVARDFTGDQRVDLAIVNQTSNSVQVLVQNAEGALQSLSRGGGDVVSRMPVAIAAGDFDGDGRYDAVTANNDPNSNNLSVLTNCVRDAECFTRPPIPGQAAVRGDANGDGVASAADLIVLAREITDGDGTRVEDIGRGSVAASPGADANGDGLVNAQDRIATVRRIFIGS